jgi:hypothetical protein
MEKEEPDGKKRRRKKRHGTNSEQRATHSSIFQAQRREENETKAERSEIEEEKTGPGKGTEKAQSQGKMGTSATKRAREDDTNKPTNQRRPPHHPQKDQSGHVMSQWLGVLQYLRSGGGSRFASHWYLSTRGWSKVSIITSTSGTCHRGDTPGYEGRRPNQ